MKLSTKKHLKSAVDTFVTAFVVALITVISTFNVDSLAKMDKTALVAVALGLFSAVLRALVKPAHTFVIELLTGIKGEFEEKVPAQKFKVQDTVIETSVQDGHIKAKKVTKKKK